MARTGFGRSALLAGLALVVAACGSSGSASPQHSPSGRPAPTHRPVTGGPTLKVSPDRGLRAGQQVQVSLTGFPQRATVSLYECVGTTVADRFRGCSATSSSVVYTGTSSDVGGSFVAQPAAGAGPGRGRVRCVRQCDLVGVVIKLAGGVPASPPPMATASLVFATGAAPPLADTALQDMSWISSTNGWALAAQPCTYGTCARVDVTVDGGGHWQALPDPPAQFQQGAANCAKRACVTGVWFATGTVGYLYGPSLLMTTDGGHSWRRQPGPQTETLSVVDGHVYRVAYAHSGCPGPCQPILQVADIGSTDWHTSVSQLVEPARSSAGQIVGSGSTLLLALYGSAAGPVSAQATLYRSTNGGQSWQQQTDPCAGRGPNRKTEEDLTDLAAAPGGYIAGLCAPHVGTGALAITSTDGGTDWTAAGPLVSGQYLALIAAASPTTTTVATSGTSGNGGFTARLFVSTDHGRHWRNAATERQQVTQAGVPAWLGFQTPQVGRWISGPDSYWTTHDGGRHWTKARFR